MLSRGVRDPARVLIVGAHADTMESDAAKENFWNELKPVMRSSGNISGYVEVSCKTGQGFDNLEQGIAKAMIEAKLGVMDVTLHKTSICIDTKRTTTERCDCVF